jgi:DNA polymerase III epsilon subunit-like protein
MREILIDTETTGLDPLDGHRIVEIEATPLAGASKRKGRPEGQPSKLKRRRFLRPMYRR